MSRPWRLWTGVGGGFCRGQEGTPGLREHLCGADLGDLGVFSEAVRTMGNHTGTHRCRHTFSLHAETQGSTKGSGRAPRIPGVVGGVRPPGEGRVHGISCSQRAVLLLRGGLTRSRQKSDGQVRTCPGLCFQPFPSGCPPPCFPF